MALQKDMLVDGPGIKIRITDPNPAAPRAVLVEGAAMHAAFFAPPEIAFKPLGKSGREWITADGGFVLHDWHGDGSEVDLDHWNG